MRSAIRLFCCAATTAAFTALPIATAHAAPADPQAILRQGVEEVLAVAYDQPRGETPLSQRLRPVLDKYFDFTAVTRRAVGPGWRRFSPEQQQKTIALFTDLVLRTYADSFEPGPRPTIAYSTPVTLSPTRRELPSVITYEGKHYAVAYRMEQAGESWRAYDVIIEGVSMVSNYRAQFDELLQKGVPDDVIRSLEENVRQAAAAK
jgi:phospholipid transport system substrate-binding protein